MDKPIDVQELLRICWQKKWFFFVPAALIMAAAITVTQVITPLYRSQATLLVENPNVPENVVPSLITEQIGLRLKLIERELLVKDKLLEIADRHNLYAEESEALSRPAIAARMRGRIDTQPMMTEFNEERSGGRVQATTGLQISFLDPNPRRAQLVVDDLVTAYLSRNIEGRRAVAETTTEFLANERAMLDQRIAAIEEQLTRFKMENRDLLPEEAAFKRQLLQNIEQRLRGLQSDLQVLRERESYISTQLALINEFEGRQGGTLAANLEVLRGELATAQARYSSTHPDVVRLQREVRSLERVVGARSGSSSTLAEQEASLRADLAALLERYTDDHPDVERAQRELGAIRALIRNGDGGAPVAAGGTRNTGYIQLSAQLNGLQAEISAIEEQQAALREERETLQAELARAPEVELEYNTIRRQLENAVADRDALADKEATTRLSGALESTAAGEHLSLAELPSAPSSPYSPNKKLILAAGLVLAVGSGGASLLGAQLLDRSIRSSRDLARMLGDAPLVDIPFITTAASRRRKWLWRFGGAVGVLVIAAAALSWAHTRIVPLDVLGSDAANKAEQWIDTTRNRPTDDPSNIKVQ